MISRRQDNKLAQRIAELEEQVHAMRANQMRKVYFGNILIDGSGNQATINIGNTITITADENNHGTILISDGTNNRVLIGYQQNGF